MKQYCLLLFFLFFCNIVFSQNEAEVYLSYPDVVCKKVAYTLPDIICKRQNANQLVWSGGREYKIYTEDKKMNKKIKKEFAAVLLNDSLYLNLRKIKCKGKTFGNGYVDCFVKDTSIFFVTYPVISDGATMAGVFGGAIGASIEASNRIKKQVYYELIPQTKKTSQVTADRMLQLLSDHPNLLEQFNQEEKMKETEKVRKYMDLLRSKEDIY